MTCAIVKHDAYVVVQGLRGMLRVVRSLHMEQQRDLNMGEVRSLLRHYARIAYGIKG